MPLTWVDVNLPWDAPREAREPLYKLSEEFRQWSEAARLEALGPPPKSGFVGTEIYRQVDAVLQREPRLNERARFSDPAWVAEIEAANALDLEVISLARYRHASRLYAEREAAWYSSEPRSAEFMEELERARAEINAGQFSAQPMNRPGVLIEIEDPEDGVQRLLIGDNFDDVGMGRYIVRRYCDLRPLLEQVPE